MKKPTIFAIICVFILSIVIVGVFGVDITVDKPVIYQANIICEALLFSETNYKLIYDDVSAKYLINGIDSKHYIKYADNLKFSVFYNVAPDNATRKDVNISVSNSYFATVDNLTGIISLINIPDDYTSKFIIFDITLKATDGSNIESTISFMAKVE